MRERLRESLQFLNRASHSVTDLLSRAMPFIWGEETMEIRTGPSTLKQCTLVFLIFLSGALVSWLIFN